MSTKLEHANTHSHHLVELPGERVKVIATILLNINLFIILH